MLDAPPFVVREQIDEGKWQPPIYAREAVKPALGDDYGQELPSRWRSSEQYLVKTPYYGFEDTILCTGHGDQVGGHYFQWPRSLGVEQIGRASGGEKVCQDV